MEMALLKYLRPKDGLPDPKGSLSLSMPSQAIAEANRQVEDETRTKKRASGTAQKFVLK